jgi:hypothetical protein
MNNILDKEYRVTKNGLSLLERSLERLERIEPLIQSVDVHLAYQQTVHDIEWFLYNEITEVDQKL